MELPRKRTRRRGPTRSIVSRASWWVPTIEPLIVIPLSTAFAAFNELIPEIERRTIDTFEIIQADDEDWTPEQAKLIRPSATWTYLVHDSPFGSDMGRLASFVGKGLRKRR